VDPFWIFTLPARHLLESSIHLEEKHLLFATISEVLNDNGAFEPWEYYLFVHLGGLRGSSSVLRLTIYWIEGKNCHPHLKNKEGRQNLIFRYASTSHRHLGSLWVLRAASAHAYDANSEMPCSHRNRPRGVLRGLKQIMAAVLLRAFKLFFTSSPLRLPCRNPRGSKYRRTGFLPASQRRS
jgi:hypothetical protein